jgi:hypothetical protein
MFRIVAADAKNFADGIMPTVRETCGPHGRSSLFARP